MQIKKLMFPVLFIGVFAACQKDDNSIQSVANPDHSKFEPVAAGIAPSPLAYTQKVLVEMYSTVSCATCPDSEQKLKNYAAAKPDRVYGANIHTGDAMSNPQFTFLNGLFNITQYSSGSFNRLPYIGSAVIHKTKWASSNIINTSLNKTAKCGLKINSTISGNTLNTTVTAGFGQTMVGNYNITVYLIENGVSGTGAGYNQSNYYNTIAGSQWYQLGNPIIGYVHDNVLRKVATPAIGTPITAISMIPGGSFTKSFTIDVTGYNQANLYLIAFINKVGTNGVTHEIMNVQQVKAGQNKGWN